MITLKRPLEMVTPEQAPRTRPPERRLERVIHEKQERELRSGHLRALTGLDKKEMRMGDVVSRVAI